MRMPIAHLNVDLVVARTAEGHEVAAIVCAAFTDRDDVVHLFHERDPSFCQTPLAKRMLRSIAIPDPFPGTTVLPVHIRCAGIFVVLPVYFFPVLFAVLSVRESGTAGPGAGSFWFRRHFLIFFPVSFTI